MTQSPDVPLATRDVPAFPCVIYFRHAGGTVVGRVVNLDPSHESTRPFEATGASERDVMSRLVPSFKQHVAHLHAKGAEIPWLETLPDPGPDEVKRFVPIHL